MALQTQSQNPFSRKLLQLLGWLVILHGSALTFLYAFALAVGIL